MRGEGIVGRGFQRNKFKNNSQQPRDSVMFKSQLVFILDEMLIISGFQ